MNIEPRQIIIGTSGYSYPDWQGVFYPRTLSKKEWLQFYSSHFDFCELNFSYYRMPQARQLEKYLEVPLKLAVKGHRTLTHDRLEAKAAREDFLEAVSILNDTGQLVSVLLQFPFSFNYAADNRRYLLELLEDLSALPLVVEFRNPEWYRDSVYEQLRIGGWGICMVDAPDVSGSVPPAAVVTSPLGYLRFHGKNRENWWSGDNVSRYDYLYDTEELKKWLPRISSMAKQSETVYIAFNNHARGQALKNAKDLQQLLNIKSPEKTS